MRFRIGTLLAATLLTLCLGLQVLEATGRWDRTLQDTGDEAVTVTVVLCVGAALVIARAARYTVCLSAIRWRVSPIGDAADGPSGPRPTSPTLYTSPPASLRI